MSRRGGRNQSSGGSAAWRPAADETRSAERDGFLRQLLRAQEEERRRIVRELHDETGQSLAALMAGFSSLLEEVSDPEIRRRIGQLIYTASAAIEGVRRMARGLRPSVLDDQGLAAAVELLAADFAAAHGIRVDLQISPGACRERLPGEMETTLYRIVQEALTNVARHSGASEVSLICERRDGQVHMVIEDNGRGLASEEERTDDSAGHGLRGIRERVSLLHGSFELESEPGRTALHFMIPMEGADEPNRSPHR